MASNYRLTYWDLIERVSEYLGTGLAPSGDALSIVRICIHDGYWMFLNPPVLPGEEVPHEWSYLSPIATLELLVGEYAYTLPTDFGGLIAPFTFATGESDVNQILQAHEGRIRRLRSEFDKSGDPDIVAIRPLEYTTAAGQTWEAVFYPTPSLARTLKYRYKREINKLDTPIASGQGTIIADADGVYNTLQDTSADFSDVTAGCKIIISNADGPTEGIYVVSSVTESEESASASASASPSESAEVTTTEVVVTGDFVSGGTCTYEILPQYIYPVGAFQCAMGIIEACLHYAELAKNDDQGIHYAAFMRHLEACVDRDRAKGAKSLGYCGDASDELERPGMYRRRSVPVFYNGIDPT